MAGRGDLPGRRLREITVAERPLVGFAGHLIEARGLDHGAWTVLKFLYPEADVPVFQVSMQKGYDPAAHFALGRALATLRDEGVLIVGSGLSYHNLRLFGPKAKEPSTAFDAWLGEVLERPAADRTAALLDWESAPFARVSWWMRMVLLVR